MAKARPISSIEVLEEDHESFEQAERDLQSDFHWNRGQSRLLWEQARDAVRAAFVRRWIHSLTGDPT